MPELPDITIYLEALEQRVIGETLERVRLGNPFLLRTAEPPPASVFGERATRLRRLGKRIAIGLENGAWLVIHLMIAGRLQWHETGKALPGKRGLAAFDFGSGCLILTEAGSKRRASLHLVSNSEDLAAHDRGGLEVLQIDAGEFRRALQRENHTLNRALTDQRLFSGIGNAYSDEILHAARLSPVRLTQKLSDAELKRLYEATRKTLFEWIAVLRAETGREFPARITAFRDGMAVHGRYGKPCLVCDMPVQRIRYASNETNYCARCQNNDKLLADRSLSRLLKKDWPKSIDELD